jgi:hypothetical protein
MLPQALSFLKKKQNTPGVRETLGADMEFNLMDYEAYNVPQVPGVYVIVSLDGTKFQYPKGKSPVMYIGMSDNLYSRIKDHATSVKYVADRINDYSRMNCQCHQRYHYFREFGAKVYIFSHRGTQSPKEQEALFLGKFYEKYFSLPVSNSARSFSQK